MSFWWQPLPLAGSLLLDEESVAPPTLANGTTLAALQAGSGSFKLTAVIEGYQYILTDATAQQAIDAWSVVSATHHYTQALGGLYVSLNNSQILDWRKPFPRGGQLTLHIAPDASDTFGVDTHKRNAGQQTEMTVTADRKFSQDTGTAVIKVKSTTGFASSGDAFIGTECFGYTGVTSDSFTGCVRGKYSPFQSSYAGLGGWSEHHRVGQNALEVLLQPLVTSLPRAWRGKWVGLYLHKYDASINALNGRDDALCVFAGRVESIVDDPATGHMVVEVKNVLDYAGDATLAGRDQWSATIRNTIRVQEKMRFQMRDFQVVAGSFTGEVADDLVCKVGASGEYEIEPGMYTRAQLYQILNAWLLKAKADSDLHGNYSWGDYLPSDNTIRSYLWWSHTGAASSTTVGFRLRLPSHVAARLGWDGTAGNANVSVSNSALGGFTMVDIGDGGGISGSANQATVSNKTIMLFAAEPFGPSTGGLVATIDDEQGIFTDQYDQLPSADKPVTDQGLDWGIFTVDNRFLVQGSYASGLLSNVKPLSSQYGLDGIVHVPNGQQWYETPLLQNGPQEVEIRQVFVLELPFGDALKRVFKSTGTETYNDATWDTFAYGLGIGIPNELTDTRFLASIDALPHANKPVVLLMDRQIKLSAMLDGELILRRAFLRWKEGQLEFATWKSPTEANSIGTLTESNKAAPAGNVDHHRSVTSEDGSWSAPYVKIQYNRTLKASPDGTDGYRDTLVIADKTALDDLGGDGPTVTINARGTMGDFAQTGTTVGSLSAGFMATMPLFSRPARKSSRSIDHRYFEGFSIGDVVLVTDAYARDPDTGARGVATRPAIIIGHRYTWGGFQPNGDSVQPHGGEVDLFFLDLNRLAAYVPCMQVDDTKANGGYFVDDFLLYTYPHKHSESPESFDAAQFSNGDKVRIIEIDPADPAAPLSWDRTISSVITNEPSGTESEILLTAALESPAWDSTKKYRIIFDDYGDAEATQQTKTFQADDADGMVANARVPFEYGIGGGDSNYTAWTASDPVELVPNASYGDGVGRDVGHEVAIIRTVNNLISYKTARSSPHLVNEIMNPFGDFTAEFATTTWHCVLCFPIDLSLEILSNDIWRRVAVAPFMRARDGGEAHCRITLSRTPPTHTSWFDVNRGSVISEITFETSNSNWHTPTPDNLVANVKALDGTAWIYVECNTVCETYGLAHCQEGAILY